MDASLQTVLLSLPSTVLADLFSIGVCPRCIFRYLGVRNAVYMDSSLTPARISSFLMSSAAICVKESSMIGEEGSQTGIGTQSSTDQESWNNLYQGGMSNPCVVCLGVLHMLDDVVVKDKQLNGLKGEIIDRISTTKLCILEAVQSEGHQFDSFCLEVTIPGAVLVREHAVCQYLRNKYLSESWFEGRNINDNLISLKDALKWSLAKPLENMLGAKFDAGSFFRIALVYKHLEASLEIESLGCAARSGIKRRLHGQNENENTSGHATLTANKALLDRNESLAAIERALASMPSETFERRYPCPPLKLNALCEISAICYRSSIYVGGRYLKFSRNISQSQWLIEDERMGDGSVQEIIGDIVSPQFKADSYKFHAAGREDIDVRMLGNGRPFILELLNARILLPQKELSKLESRINSLKEGWVKVKGLKQVGKDAWNLMLEGEAEKQKEYTAVVWVSRPVTKADFDHLASMKDMEIQQKTPVRVLHRRSPLVRARKIHWMCCEEITGSQEYFLLHLCTQAGTYIKEFVHGDLGRTYPNIGTLLGCEAEIMQLDVTNIKMDFF